MQSPSAKETKRPEKGVNARDNQVNSKGMDRQMEEMFETIRKVKQNIDNNSSFMDELNVSFRYQYNSKMSDKAEFGCKVELSEEIESQYSSMKIRNHFFSSLFGAALSANVSLTNGLTECENLPVLDSPKSFRRMASSSFSRLDNQSSFSLGTMTSSACSLSVESDMFESGRSTSYSSSDLSSGASSGFLTTMDIMAEGAAGEDRVQAVCSEEDGWLFCGVYDGFNGPDASEFLGRTFYNYIMSCLHKLDPKSEQCEGYTNDTECSMMEGAGESMLCLVNENLAAACNSKLSDFQGEVSEQSFCLAVLDCLSKALAQAENDFMLMVEEKMDVRPDLVSVGSTILTILLHGKDMYVLNLGDSQAVLATTDKNGSVQAIQLTEIHRTDNEIEYKKILVNHPNEPAPIYYGKVKGKLKLTRAFGVGYLKKRKLNSALVGILRVQNLWSPPYISTHPFTMSHRVLDSDLFVVMGSDGLFDFFKNSEIVEIVHLFIQHNPFGDPAKYLIEQLVGRAARKEGCTVIELMSIPAGIRRSYHDAVIVIVIILGNRQMTSKASTSL